MGAYYTPEEIFWCFMSRRTIHPYLHSTRKVTRLMPNTARFDDVFGLSGVEVCRWFSGVSGWRNDEFDKSPLITWRRNTSKRFSRHPKTRYNVLDPAVGSGAFLLAAQDVLVDIYMQCIEYFHSLKRR